MCGTQPFRSIRVKLRVATPSSNAQAAGGFSEKGMLRVLSSDGVPAFAGNKTVANP